MTYSELKTSPTYTLKVLINLLGVLQDQSERSKANYILLADSDFAKDVPIAFFQNEEEAKYAKRKLTKIVRLSFSNILKIKIASV